MMTSSGATPGKANRPFQRTSSYNGSVDTGLEWLGEIPEHWELRPLQYCLNESKLRNGARPVGEMLSVSGYSGVSIKEYDHEAKKRSVEDLKNYRVVRPGQLVVNSMWLNHCGLGVSQHEGYVSPAYEVYSIGDDLHQEYVHYLMRSTRYVDRYKSLLYGIRPNSLQIKSSDWDSIPLLIPPLHEQRAIADYLTLRTTAIDNLIAKKERLIELLVEKRTAHITQAVTKGLDPDVPMKDSGVEWLGEIPEHWELTALKYLTEPHRPITYGIVQCGPDVPNGVPYIRPVDMSDEGGVASDQLQKTSYEIAAQYERSELKPGDLVVSIGPSFGKVMVVPPELEGANLTQGTARVSAGPRVDRDFLFWLLRSSGLQQAWDAECSGATFRALTLKILRSSAIPLPPIGEQRTIAAALRKQSEKIDQVRRVGDSAVSLLEEYRSALITAAVTGKIDVRDHAA